MYVHPIRAWRTFNKYLKRSKFHHFASQKKWQLINWKVNYFQTFLRLFGSCYFIYKTFPCFHKKPANLFIYHGGHESRVINGRWQKHPYPCVVYKSISVSIWNGRYKLTNFPRLLVYIVSILQRQLMTRRCHTITNMWFNRPVGERNQFWRCC
jgi:hypothetical protein